MDRGILRSCGVISNPAKGAVDGSERLTCELVEGLARDLNNSSMNSSREASGPKWAR